MNLKKKIPIQVYDCVVEFQVTDDIMKEYNKLRKRYNIDDVYESLDGVFVKSGDGKKNHILVALNCLTHNTISHEVYHGATRICEARSINDEETRAWLDGYLTGEIYKFLDRKKQPIKHG
jgi:hypothetical protein